MRHTASYQRLGLYHGDLWWYFSHVAQRWILLVSW